VSRNCHSGAVRDFREWTASQRWLRRTHVDDEQPDGDRKADEHGQDDIEDVGA